MQKQVALVQMLDTMALVRRARTALANGGKRALTSLIRLIELILCNMFGQRVWRGMARTCWARTTNTPRPT